MPVAKFNVGDYVMLLRDHPDDNPELFVGDVGVVVVTDGDKRVGVNWFKPIGHSCSGHLSGDDGNNGWYVDKKDLALSYAPEELEVLPEDLPDISELF